MEYDDNKLQLTNVVAEIEDNSTRKAENETKTKAELEEIQVIRYEVLVSLWKIYGA